MYNKLIILCLLDGKPYTKFKAFMRDKPEEEIIGHKDATNRRFL